jgi:hypothetical protein
MAKVAEGRGAWLVRHAGALIAGLAQGEGHRYLCGIKERKEGGRGDINKTMEKSVAWVRTYSAVLLPPIEREKVNR